MDDTTGKAVIAAISAIVGAIAKELAPELKPLLLGKARMNSDLIGKWNCTWSVKEDSKEIPDKVEISRVWGEKIWAIGINTAYGDYRIVGRVSKSSLVTLHYEGVERRQPLGGVVILKLNAMRTEMTGSWYEYGRRERIIAGDTTWNREPS
jgi:hypothetical protein